MALVNVGGVNLPAPSAYSAIAQDIGKWERNARATMIGEFIARKAKIQMSWKYLNQNDLSTILNAIDPLFFSVTYLDEQTQTYKTGTFYKGDRTMPLYDFMNDVPRYSDFTVNLIER